ncbi:hypothetical protein DRJ17_00595 [Candidatus Woesearchaeota archaeon]|nr:MAG: hypothetical protein DRJ17_00595 [Candidatus Woesearchaeota archaeon]
MKYKKYIGSPIYYNHQERVMVRHFKNLDIYKDSYTLSLELYRLTDTFPLNAVSLRSQFRRAIFSTFLNIAEGSGKSSIKEYYYYVNIAYSSCRELVALVSFSCELGYIKPNSAETYLHKLDILSAKLFNFMKYLEKHDYKIKTAIKKYTYSRMIS